MPRKKSFVSIEKKPVEQSQSSSYTSLLYGIISVFVLFLILVFGFRVLFQREQAGVSDQGPTDIAETLKSNSTEHIVVQGETLWSISEKYYNTGFEWKRIADINKIKEPYDVEPGTKILIPKPTEEEKLPEVATEVSTPTPTQVALGASDDQKIDSNIYVVQYGDTLWDIAVRSYGDGFRWVEISRANNLINPNLIHPGNRFIIPQK